MQLHILLKLGVDLPAGQVLSYTYSVNSVIAHNSAPEGVVKVKGKHLLVLA